MLDEIERALHDALCIVKRLLQSNTVNPSIPTISSCLFMIMMEDHDFEPFPIHCTRTNVS